MSITTHALSQRSGVSAEPSRGVLEGPGLVAWSNPYTPRRTAASPPGMGIASSPC